MPVALNVRSVTWMNAGRKLTFRLSANKLEVDISGVTADPVDTIIKIVLHKPVPETPTAQLRQMPRPKAKPGNLAYMKPAKLLSLDCKRELTPSTEVLYASKAVDGYPNTCAEAGWEYPWTLHVDMLAEQAIGRLVVTFAKAAYATEYKIALSLDGAEWTTVAHVTGCTGGAQTHTFDPMRVRYIRVFGIKPDGPNQPGAQMAISELEVYAR